MSLIKFTDEWLKWLGIVFLISLPFNSWVESLLGFPHLFLNAFKIFYYGLFPFIGIWLCLMLIFSSWVKDNEPKKVQVYKLGKLAELALVLGMVVGYVIAFV